MRDTKFDWMNEAIYQPSASTLEPPRHSRFRRIFLSLAIIAIATGILLAVAA